MENLGRRYFIKGWLGKVASGCGGRKGKERERGMDVKREDRKGKGRRWETEGRKVKKGETGEERICKIQR